VVATVRTAGRSGGGPCAPRWWPSTARLADDSAAGGDRSRQPDLDRVRARQAAGEVGADLDPAAVLLAGLGMIAAPLALPQVARELFGIDPSSEEFLTRYGEQIRRIVARLGGKQAS
jgi:TetR/AcrR family transcriptional regulator